MYSFQELVYLSVAAFCCAFLATDAFLLDAFCGSSFTTPVNKAQIQRSNLSRSGANVLMMSKRKGGLKKQTVNSKSKKQLIKEETKQLEGRAPGSPLGIESEPEKLPAGATDKSQIVIANGDDDDDEPGMTPSMREGDNLIRYAKANGLAINLETMNVVEVPKRKIEKIAACFPQATQELRDKYPLSNQPTVEEFLAAINPLVPGESTDVSKLKEFLLANRHVGGSRATKSLVQLQLKAQSKGDKPLAQRMRHLALAVMKAESAITGPFRQAMKNAENRIAPYMGSTDVLAYAGPDTADATATFLCLKAVVAEWEKRYQELINQEMSIVDVLEIEDFVEKKMDKTNTGRICGAVQAMSQAFADSKDAFGLLTPEAKFIEKTLSVDTSSEVRRIALQEICPSQEILPEEFRRRMLNLLLNVESLPSSSYSQLQRAILELYDCLVQGTPDAYDIYVDNMKENGYLRFETYDLVKANNEPWRQRLHKLVTLKRPASEDEQDYTSMFKALTPNFGALFAAPEVIPVNWVNMLETNAENDLLQDLAKTDEQEALDKFGDDIFDDFERRYGLESPEADGDLQNID